MLRCSSCAYEAREWRAPFETETTFVFSRHTRCIHCGTYRVRRLRGRDRIDSMSAHPLSLLFALAWAPIYHCNACRLQYRDWRPTAPFIEAKNSSAAVSAGAE